MSEYRWGVFRSVHAPLNEAALEFMLEQSTRADSDRWRFARNLSSAG